MINNGIKMQRYKVAARNVKNIWSREHITKGNSAPLFLDSIFLTIVYFRIKFYLVNTNYKECLLKV